MKIKNTVPAISIKLWDFKSPQMRAFHFSWFAFFLCFFGWFSFPALSKWVIDDLGITVSQFVTTSQWAVGSTIIMRLLIGVLANKFGPRRTYAWLLILGAIPVFLSAFIQNYEQLLVVRIFVGAIGASFVLTQVHTSLMFAPNIVGTANATTAGWGNLGGGVTQQIMPLLLVGFAFFMPEELAWRYAMAVPSFFMVIMGFLYYKYTQDTPTGNFKPLDKKDTFTLKPLLIAVKDYRVVLLFIIYGACFGIELIVNSNIALYLINDINITPILAASIASIFGLMNLFARTLGGYYGDKFGKKSGLNGRVKWLFTTLFVEGCVLLVFAQFHSITALVPILIVFSLFVQMAEGATFSIVPFVNKKLTSVIAGIVGAGGNTGAVLGLFLFKIEGFSWSYAFMTLGVLVLGVSFLSLLIKFSPSEDENAEKELVKIRKIHKELQLN